MVKKLLKSCLNLNLADHLFVRVNTLKTNTDELIKLLADKGISAEKSKLIENAVLIENSGSLTRLAEFKKGLFHIEDISSQLCCEVLAPQKVTGCLMSVPHLVEKALLWQK